MTIAVTGATGHLDALVIDHLLETTDPADVVAVVRDPAMAAAPAGRGVTVRTAVYTEPADPRTGFDGVDTLMFVSSSEAGQRVEQHRNVIDAAVAEEYLVASGLPPRWC